MQFEDIQKAIASNEAILLYFSGENCGVCQVLQPKIAEGFTQNFPKIKQLFISATHFPEISAAFGVFTVPTVLVYFDQKETRRESRHISVDRLLQNMQRTYGLFFDEN